MAALLAGCGAQPAPDAGSLATCAVTADCAIFDDGDPCTGAWACTAGRCALDVASVVRCDTTADGLCAATRCDPATGTCALQPRNLGAACEDGDPCTVGDACADGACKAGSANMCSCAKDADCAVEEDGDVCNGTLYCDVSRFPYRCAVKVSSVVTCPAGGPCLVSACDPLTGACAATVKADDTTCDDGDACTQVDRCLKGVCVGGQNACTCNQNSDCGAQEDGDLCNGTLYCDQVSHSCVVNPVTVVVCPTIGDTTCSARLCQPTTGLCVMSAVHQGKACDDGDACTIAQICQGGLCAGGKNACVCTKDTDCAKAEDGNACNGTLFCNQQNGVCTLNPATVVTCPSGLDTACTHNACVLATGSCAATPTELTAKICAAPVGDNPAACRIEQLVKGAPTPLVLCDDGDLCTASDTCSEGKCLAGTQVCTCKTDADCVKQDDGDLCNGVAFCEKASGTCKPNPATVVTCPTVDDTTCLKRSCQPKTGKCPLIAQKNGALCEDGNTCTQGDVCIFGQCSPGANTCECQNNTDCLSKDDGDLCNGVPYCDRSDPKKPFCKENKASVVFCPSSSSPCATLVCNPSNGICQPKPVTDGKGCDDGTVCTKISSCLGGVCVGGGKLTCDDSDACTLDTCDAKTGCLHVQSNCKDGNSCTTDACDAKTGACSFPARAKGSPCDADQSGCTLGDSCNAGSCVAGPAVVCALPTKACEQAVCLAKGAGAYQCVVAAKKDGAACEDGDVCSLSSVCAKGSCVAKSGSVGLFAKGYAPPSGMAGRLQAIAVVGTADYLLGGAAWSKSGAEQPWLLRVAADGQTKWQLTQTAKDGNGSGAIVGILPSSGAAVVLRNQPVSGGLLSGFFDVVTLTGKQVQLTAPIKPTGGVVALAGGVALTDGSLLLGGTRTASKKQTAWATRVTAAGQPLWAASVGALSTRVHGVGAPLGALVLVGDRGLPNQRRAFAAQISPVGVVQWQVTLSGSAGDRLNGVSHAPGGGLLLVGTRKATTKPRGWMVAMDEDGQRRWTREVSSPSALAAAVRLGDRGVRVVGRSIITAKLTHASLIGGDELGNTVFTRTLTGAPIADALAILAHDDDSVAIVGQRSSATGQRQGLLWRVGAFGHETCAAQGQCVGKKLADCDDGLPCTVNFCKASTGCSYPPSAGFACDPADGCHLDGVCVGLACKPGQRTRLFTHAGDATARVWTGVVAAGSSGWLLFGRDSKFNSVIERIDATGTALWSQIYADMAKPMKNLPTVIGGAVQTSDGGMIVAVTQTLKGSTSLVATVRRIDAAGHVNAAFGLNVKALVDKGSASDLVSVPGTSDVVLIAQKDADVTVTRLTDAGKKVWVQHTFYKNQFKRRVAVGARVTGLAMGDGGVVVGATLTALTSNEGPWQPHLHRVNGNGVVIWHRDVVGLGAVKLSRLVRRADGARLAIGWVPTPAQDGARLWMARFDDAGKVLWQRDHALNLRPSGVVATPDGGFALLGTHTTPQKTSALLLAKVGPGGGVWWQRSLTLTGSSASAGASDSLGVTATGGLLAVGRSFVGVQTAKPLLMRLDPWGHGSCAEAGACGKLVANPKTASCDDSKPCTVDRCDPKSGACSHAAAADGLACGDAKVCVAGVCTDEPPGMLLIAKGTFYMGCNIAQDQQCQSDEKPVRKLQMKSFWIHRGEVTRGQVKTCNDQGKCGPSVGWSLGERDLPAATISLKGMKAYCAFIGGRLPSEAEWAYAAKGSCALVAGGLANCAAAMPIQYRPQSLTACGWAKQHSGWAYAYGCSSKVPRVAGAASGDRSPWGVLDMGGNLREMVADLYIASGYTADYTKYPFGKTLGGNALVHAVRGGTFQATVDKQLGLSRRLGMFATTTNAVQGFRCVREP